jgi:DNA end-binding protein Ku
MPRAIWTGSISFGLVNIPVKVYSAIQKHKVSFHQLAARTGHRIRNKRVDEKTGREVDYEDIVKAYEVSDGQYVEVTDEEFEALKPRSSRTIDIEDFVDLHEIDPIYYERTYFLAPHDDDGAKRAYTLLLKAMTDQQRVGIGRVVMREKQYLAAVRPMGNVLAMSTMLFADEVRDPKEIDAVPARLGNVPKREAAMAASLVDSLATDWNPKRYKDTYQDELKKLIASKDKGEKVVIREESSAPSKVIDLMAALEASVAAAKKGGSKALLREVRRPPNAEEADENADEKPAAEKKAGPKKKASRRSAA